MKFKIPKFLKNIYILIFLGFIIWMLFFDSNSLIVHYELNTKIEEIKNKENYYEQEIKKDKTEFLKIKTDSGLEKYAREELFMKKENEDIYIIEYDSID